MRTCGFVGWVELVELLDDAGGGAGGDEAAGAVEEVFLVGPDGAGAEAGHDVAALGLVVELSSAT